MAATDLHSIAQAIAAEGKGILAADESSPTIKKRFTSIDVESTEENRRSYRQLLFTTPGINEYISGVILFDETLRQKADDGTSFVEILQKQNIVPGIKVDKGAKDLAGSPGEKVTEGLDGLRDRLNEYYDLGARFAKWRAVIAISNTIPSQYCIDTNAHALARYAALSQEAGLVPIVEPEVLMDGNHTIQKCYQVTEVTLKSVFQALFDQNVMLEGLLLKPNMVLSGKDCSQQADPDEVAEATVRCFHNTVPAAVPGIMFLSGGQTNEIATANLNAMNAMNVTHPWQLSFSYGRALQGPPLKAWRGDAANIEKAKQVFHHRAKCNGAARYGKYSAAMEQELVEAGA